MQEHLGSSPQRNYPPSISKGLLGHDKFSPELEEIEKEWEVDITKLSHKEQTVLIKLVKRLDEFNLFYITGAIRDWDSNKRLILIKALALAENNAEYEDALLNFIAIGEDNERVSEVVVQKISEIVSAIYDIKQIITQYYQKPNNLTEQQIDQIRKKLIKKLFDFIVKTSEKEHKTNLFNKNIEGIFVSQLEQIKTETDIYTTVFKNVSLRARAEGQKINFADFINTKFEIAQAYELTNEELKAMEQIYRENYPSRAYPAEFREALAKSLYPQDEVNSHFYIVKHEDKITAFARFENIFDKEGKLESIHFGAFNLNPKYEGGLIGEEMMRQFLKSEASHGVPIHAECDPRTKISKKYLEMGFVVRDEFDFHGVPSWNIVLNPGALKGL